MGLCLISVRVIGAHHTEHEDDIDALAREFVATLQAHGYSVQSATLCVPNADEDLRAPHAASTSDASVIAPGATALGALDGVAPSHDSA